MSNKTVLITGASSGIGWATAEKFAAAGYALVLCGRRKEKLEELVKKLNVPTHILVFDVSDKAAVFNVIDQLPPPFQKIDILINNAGNAHGMDSVQKAALKDWEAMMDSNVKGLMYVTKAILPQMVARKGGHIINLGSTAGKEVYPNGSVYCASKFAVDAFTKGLRIDLNPFEIKVGAINPGLVHTEFSKVRFKGDLQRAEKVYAGMQPLMASDVADAIFYMASAPAHVNIADLVLLPTHQANSYVAKREL